MERQGYEVVAEARCYEDAASALDACRPDIVLLDIGLDDEDAGLRLAESDGFPSATAIVFVSGRTDGRTLARIEGIGPAGFVVKPFRDAQVVAAITAAIGQHRANARGARPRQLTRALDALVRVAREVERVRDLTGVGRSAQRSIRDLELLDALSPREWDVLLGLVDHHRPAAIAARLGISHHTVRNHLKSIYAKLGVHSQAELLDLVLEPEP